MILTDSGHIALAIAMKSKKFYLGWGTLDSGFWTDTPPREDATDKTLKKPVGIVATENISYVKPSTTGTIETDNAKWEVSADPTKYLYMKFRFTQTQNADSVIYQLGIFSDTTFSANPTDQYHLATDVADWGNLVMYENISPIHRNSTTKENFEFVITF